MFNNNQIAREVFLRVPLVLFFIFAVTFVLARSPLLYNLSLDQNVISFGAQGLWSDYHEWGLSCSERPCYRVVGAVLGNGIEWLYTWAASLLFWDVSRSAFDAFSPWTFDDKVFQNIHTVTVPIATYITFGIACFLPVYWMAREMFVSIIARSAFIILVMTSTFGWHPTIVTSFFNFASLFVDWPRSYFLYAGRLQYFDITALGVTALLIMFASTRTQTTALIILMTILAQLTMEHLGVVLAVSLFISHLFSDAAPTVQDRVKGAFVKCFIVGGTLFILTATTMIYLYLIGQQQIVAESYTLAGLWKQFLNQPALINNFKWIKSILANAATLTAIPMIMGIFVGVIAAWISGDINDEKYAQVRRHMIAAASVTAGLLTTFLIGLLVARYPSDMGREFPTISLAASVLGAKGSEFLYHMSARHYWRRPI